MRTYLVYYLLYYSIHHSVQLKLRQPAIEGAAYEGFLPCSAQADGLEVLTLAEINVGNRAGATLFQKVAEGLVKVVQVQLLPHPHTVGRIRDDRAPVNRRQAAEVTRREAHPVAERQTPQVRPRRFNRLCRKVAAADQPFGERPDLLVHLLPYSLPNVRPEIRQILEPEPLVQVPRGNAAIPHQGLGE